MIEWTLCIRIIICISKNIAQQEVDRILTDLGPDSLTPILEPTCLAQVIRCDLDDKSKASKDASK